MEYSDNFVIGINDDWLIPTSNNWKYAYDIAKQHLNKCNSTDAFKNKLQQLDAFLEILIKDGNVNEDVVLKTAIFYFLVDKCNYKVEDINFSKIIVDGVNILTSKNKNYLVKIFKNTQYAYLNKIKLAMCIAELKNNIGFDDAVKNIILKAEVQTILQSFKDYSNKNLYYLLEKLKQEA